MRQRIIMLQLDHLRIDHNEPQLIRRKSVQQRSNNRIDANRFSRARAPGDQQVRHFAQIRDDRVAIDILAQRQWNTGLRIAPFFRFQQIAHDHFSLDGIGNFHSYRAFPGHRRQDVDTFSL